MAAEQSTVEYRDIQGHPGYRIGDDGSVWSAWRLRFLPGGGTASYVGDRWKRLADTVYRRTGYRFNTLNGVNCNVHRLVLQTFVGPCPDGLECRHLNGVRSDCRLVNLCWGTFSENERDKLRHGTAAIGPRNHNTKLTSAEVVEIKKALALGESCSAIAKKYSVNHGAISAIKNGRSWRYVECP